MLRLSGSVLRAANLSLKSGIGLRAANLLQLLSADYADDADAGNMTPLHAAMLPEDRDIYKAGVSRATMAAGRRGNIRHRKRHIMSIERR